MHSSVRRYSEYIRYRRSCDGSRVPVSARRCRIPFYPFVFPDSFLVSKIIDEQRRIKRKEEEVEEKFAYTQREA